MKHHGVTIVLAIVVFLLDTINCYRIGIGIADITGPCVEITFMGYAKPDQKGTGIHTRQWARTIIIDDGTQRLVFVSADFGMMGNLLKETLLDQLHKMYGDLYNVNNVMVSGTHTHSTPGGYMGHILFDISTLGFVPETFNAYLSGLVKSIERAHNNMKEGKIYLNIGKIEDANYNRSPFSYMNNPEKERRLYDHDTDKTIFQLKLVDSNQSPIGVVNWFPVHPTSMNNTNKFVSSDNQGLASLLFEGRLDKRNVHGKKKFVAIFASSNLGDVSPNIKGPFCTFSGESCNNLHSTCPIAKEQCVAHGPGRDMYQSTYIIASRITEAAWKLFTSSESSVEITGPVRMLHQYVDMPKQNVTFFNETSGREETGRGCKQAMGASFAAGTTDGPGAFPFKQGVTTGNPLWDFLSGFLPVPDAELVNCHNPKPILIPSGLMEFPFTWQPAIVSTSIALIGNVAIVCVPGEFTTMSGRRLRSVVEKALEAGGVSNPRVTIAGLCNTYSDYITTYEEYQIQRYEAASTIYGPYTLLIYQDVYKRLAEAIARGGGVPPGPPPPVKFNDLVTFTPPVFFDTAPIGKQYGQVLQQPSSAANPGETVYCRLIGANPRNNLKHEETFLTVEMKTSSGRWVIVATDANWETKFEWVRKSPVLGTSEVVISWFIPSDVVCGQYRMRHFGNYKYVFGGVFPYEGICDVINVCS